MILQNLSGQRPPTRLLHLQHVMLSYWAGYINRLPYAPSSPYPPQNSIKSLFQKRPHDIRAEPSYIHRTRSSLHQ